MKSVHSADPTAKTAKGIVGSSRRHIISRLHKATTHAKQLVQILQDQPRSQTSPVTLLEAKAYLALLSGALLMEKQRWDQCLQQYSLARVIYAALGKQANKDSFRDLLSSAIDPSIRYAAYRLKLPRSKPLGDIAVQYFPSETSLRAEVESVDPDCLTEESCHSKKTDDAIQELPQSITWKSRTVKLEDASISQALAATSAAESRLSSWLSEISGPSSSSKEKAAAYDSVIIASQDAVDATKTAIDELSSEGVDQGDKRMQALQVTRTAVNYALIGWQVGRNRVLCGSQDGLFFGPKQVKAPRKPKEGRKPAVMREESTERRLTRLRERVALYDSTLQSLDFIRELPGVAGDAGFLEELDGKRNYFRSLR
jgi:signal recognition particle subunit SRP68